MPRTSSSRCTRPPSSSSRTTRALTRAFWRSGTARCSTACSSRRTWPRCRRSFASTTTSPWPSTRSRPRRTPGTSRSTPRRHPRPAHPARPALRRGSAPLGAGSAWAGGRGWWSASPSWRACWRPPSTTAGGTGGSGRRGCGGPVLRGGCPPCPRLGRCPLRLGGSWRRRQWSSTAARGRQPPRGAPPSRAPAPVRRWAWHGGTWRAHAPPLGASSSAQGARRARAWRLPLRPPPLPSSGG
mmetsp:Transcript_35648/g.112446  ORF Transcript_35648/g.112446 Transcript_35648/m.112446 type:complete len:241 (-) Transcript_35648:222-944(-)